MIFIWILTQFIPTKRSAEGSLPHILIPSLLKRVRERLRRGGVSPPKVCIANQQFLYSAIHLPLTCCLVFFLLSLCHVLLLRKSTKTPGTRKFQSTSFLVVNTAFTATRAAPISSVLRTTNCWRCRRFKNSRVASDIFQSKRVLKHTPWGN